MIHGRPRVCCHICLFGAGSASTPPPPPPPPEGDGQDIASGDPAAKPAADSTMLDTTESKEGAMHAAGVHEGGT